MPEPPTAPPRDAEATARTLLELIRTLLQETQGRVPPAVTLDSRLDRELGLDSLARTELFARLEKALGVGLPETALALETPRELLRAILTAGGSPRPVPAAAVNVPPPPGGAEVPLHAATLTEVLDWHARTQPERIYLYLYEAGDAPQAELSFGELHRGARTVAAGLQARGLEPGQTVAMMLPTGRGYFFSFFGALLAGGVPVPLYPPLRPAQLAEHLRRHGRILDNAGATVLIAPPEAGPVARQLQAQAAALRQVVTWEELARSAPIQTGLPLRAEELALLQYTSGSTGDPKGVMLTHANLLANIRAMGTRIQVRPTDVFVSWLPLYHDMGLIGAFLGSLHYGIPLAIMPPTAFMTRPARWLWAIHRHRGTLSAAPNFAYELCLRTLNEASLTGLDLSSWRMAFNGAEPVNPDTVEGFSRRLAPYGFPATTLAPVYGLAEASVGLALQPPERGPVIDRIQRHPFTRTGQALPAAADDPQALRLVSCGQPLPGHQVRIVDAQGRELPERQEGRLEFQGPSCTSGYWRNPEATRRLFHGDWLDSGDRAYIAGGDIYLTGRTKDVIIRGGRNLYPYELEEAVGRIPGIRQGNVAVFAGTAPQGGAERLVVVAETRKSAPQDREALQQSIQAVCLDLLALPADEVVLVPPHTVLKTSSGKIRRAAVRTLYERNALGPGARAARWPWQWPLLRAALAGLGPRLRRLQYRSLEVLYAGYAWTVGGCLAALLWLALLVIPSPEQRWAAAHRSGRLLGRLAAIPLSVQGLEQLPREPCVIVANHASYLDGIVLAAALPGSLSFVAKRELQDIPVVRLPLERLGALFVERFAVQDAAAEGKRLAQALHAGRTLVFFPEGTFARMPGLLPFRMGAFLAAAQTGVPVVPVTLRGTRSMLRSGSWFLRRGALRIGIGAPLYPDGNDWQAAVRLRDAARAMILKQCGEPDLGEAGNLSL